MGELWGVCCDDFVENWPEYNSPALHNDAWDWNTTWVYFPTMVCCWKTAPYTGLDIKHLIYMPVRHMVLKIYVPCKYFHVPSQYLYKPCKLMYTAGKISTCPDWKITCPVGHVTTKVYVPWDKIYMPRACGHALNVEPWYSLMALSHYLDQCWLIISKVCGVRVQFRISKEMLKVSLISYNFQKYLSRMTATPPREQWVYKTIFFVFFKVKHNHWV